MTRRHREESGGDDGSYLYVSVTHHLRRSPDGPEVITHAELRVSDAEQIVVKAVRKPIHVTFVFFLISLWIGKNVNESFVPVNAFYFIRIAIVCMKYLFSITT